MTVLSGYKIEALIGRGGMGVVYRATDLSLQRPVALKLIAPELAEDERFRRRFLGESRIAASLDHASVVPIYEAGEADGQLFLAMRYVEGADLRTLLRHDGALERERALALLSQIASALDAAHRSGLVHRDVKPANILVDGEDHAYLTDFGVSKQLGGVTTDTGRLVGSLDYLAPEQIAGERVDPRTDQYALACVLYECLTGTPAFRRESEAETLWAHMRGQYAPIPGLEPVFKRALAREPGARYGSCAEMIEAVRTPARRRRRWLAAVPVVVAGLAVALGLLLRDGADPFPVGSGVVVFGTDGGLGSLIDTSGAPSNIAVGEGAVWALDSEAAIVTRIDPRTKAVTRFGAGPRPTDLAVGGGAVWVGNAVGTKGDRVTMDILRIDPRTLKITATVKLSRKRSVYGGLPSEGFPRIAAGAGAVWAIGYDNRIYRIDPATGRIVAKIPVKTWVSTIAAGREGVWFLNWSDRSVARIDPETNALADRVELTSEWLSGIAVGGGAVWVTSPQDGRLWRITPGFSPRPIQVAGFPQFVGYGNGSVWTGDYRDGRVVQVDDRSNTVTATHALSGVQALAAGAGSAWVSVAGASPEGTLPPALCGGIESGGAEPDVLIASNLPLRGGDQDGIRAEVDAIRWVLSEHGFRAGPYVVGYRSCEDSTAQTGAYEQRRCAANANAFARGERLVAVIGPHNSFCAGLEIPILDRAPGGPLALVSPSTTAPELTRGAPDLYPTGVRNYLRVIGRVDVEGVAHALLAQRLKLSRVYLLEAEQVDSRGVITGPFRRTADRLRIPIVGSDRYSTSRKAQDALVERVARARPDGVVIDGSEYSGGASLIAALRRRLRPGIAILVSDGFNVGELIKEAGPGARGVYQATTEALTDRISLTPAGARFVVDFGMAARLGFVLNAAQAAEVVLQAIAQSDGTRRSVLRELRSLRVTDGILGSFAFDRYGDITPAAVTILRVTGDMTFDPRLPDYVQGAAVDRVIEVPASLAG